MTAKTYAQNLCELYETYNHREFVHPDPLEFLYDYQDLRDREIVGLVASSLAYGGVRQILKGREIRARTHGVSARVPEGQFPRIAYKDLQEF